LLTLAFAGGTVGAADLPDIKAVEQHVREARGTDPTAERAIVSYDTFDSHGVETNLRSGKDTRVSTTFGPFLTAYGVFHGQAWHQNANGQTVLDQPAPGLEKQEPMVTTMVAISTPVTGFVISHLNKRGQGTKEYIDSTSWHVVRRENITATSTTVTAYDDFRTTGGLTQAWHWTARDGHVENNVDSHIVSDDAISVSGVDLAIPASRRNLVEFPAGKSSESLPVRDVNDQFIVHVDVGSRGLDLMLDTGASSIVLDDVAVKQLGLKTYGAVSNAANAGRYTSSRAIVPEMKVGDLTLHDVVVNTIPHLGNDRPGLFSTVGLLGFDFIASLVLKIDYEHQQVTALDPASFKPPTDPLTDVLPVRLGNGQPLTDVTVNGALGERFAIDTGGGGAVLIFDYFARSHPEALIDKSPAPLGLRQNLGAGGAFQTRRYELASVRVGKVNFADFVADVVTSSGSYGGRNDGVIGCKFLKLYTLYTDYQNSTLYLVPNSLGHSLIQR